MLLNYSLSAVWGRMCIALNPKGLSVTHVRHQLGKGEPRSPHDLALIPQGLAPVPERDDGIVLAGEAACLALPAFVKAEPERQADAGQPMGAARRKEIIRA